MSTAYRILVVINLVLLALPTRLFAQHGSPANTLSLRQKAADLESAGRLQEAAYAYQRALAIQPGWADGWWQFATLEYDLGNYRNSRVALSRFLHFNPKSGSAWALRGLAEFELGITRSALADLRQSDLFSVTEENNLQEIAKLHELLLDNVVGDFEQAFKIAEDLCDNATNSSSVFIAAGITALRIKSLPTGIAATQRDIVYKTGQAVCNATSGQSEKANAEFADLLNQYPTTPQLHYLYGCFLIKDRPDDGLAQFLAELSISPTHEPAMTQAALEYLRRGDDQNALSYAKQAVKISPQSAKAQFAMGRVMIDMNQLDAAIEHLKRAAALDPLDRSILWSLASAYSAAGNNRAAEQISRRLPQKGR